MALSDKFEWEAEYTPNVKLGFHIMQIIFGFVIFVLEIILFRAEKSVINGNNGWPFGLCFLSVLAWIYLIMTPRFARTQRFAQPHAMAVIDAVFAIFWLSAFASQAAYNTANSCGSACNVSKAIVGIAFFEILFWGVTTFLSIYTLRYYQFNGTLPGYDKLATSKQNIDPDKAAFSMAPHDEEAYAPINADDRDNDHHNAPYNADSYGGGRPMFDSETEYRPHSTSPAPYENPFDSSYRTHSQSPHNDHYNSGYGAAPNNGRRIYAAPAAEDYNDNQSAHFPAANYDRTLH